MGKGLKDILRAKSQLGRQDQQATDNSSLLQRLKSKSGDVQSADVDVPRETSQPSSLSTVAPTLIGATELMRAYLGTKPEEQQQANIVQFKGANPQGATKTRTYGVTPDKKIVINTEETATSVPAPVDAKSMQYQPQVGEEFRASMDKQQAQAEIAGYLTSASDNIRNDAQEMLSSAPEIIQDQLKSLHIDDNFVERLSDKSGDIESLKKYTTLKNAQLQKQYDKEIQDLEARFPLESPTGRSEFAKPTRANAEVYNQQLSDIDKKYSDQRAALNNNAFALASLKSVNEQLSTGKPVEELDPFQIGLNIRDAQGDMLEIGLVDNVAIDPAVKVQTELLGYRALEVAKAQAFADNDVEKGRALQAITDNYQRKVIDNNPEFRKQQVREAIANDVFKEGNSIWETIAGKDVTEEDVRASAERLGIPETDLEGIRPEDIKRWSGPINNTVNAFIREGVAPTVEFTGRHIINPLLRSMGSGVSDRQLDEGYNREWYDNSTIGRFFGGKAPASADLINSGTRIETNPQSENYLLTISDQNSDKWNVNGMSLLNTISNGTGQMLSFATGGNVAGSVIKGAGIVNNADKARRIGMNTYMWLTGWDRNYRQAKEVIGDAPGDEAKRLGLAMVYNAAEVASENIIPDYKITDQILGTNAVRGFLDQVKRDGVSAATKGNAVDAFKKGFLEAAKNTVGEGAEEAATVYGQAVGDLAFAPDKFEQTNYNQEALENGVVGAVSAFLPVGAGAVREARAQGPLAKSMLYEVGKNPNFYIGQFNDLVDKGEMPQVEANEKIQMVNTLGSIVKNSVPNVSPINGVALTEKQKSDYTNNLMQQAILKDKIATVQDEVQQNIYQSQLDNLVEERAQMLNISDVVTPVVTEEAPSEVAPQTDLVTNPEVAGRENQNLNTDLSNELPLMSPAPSDFATVREQLRSGSKLFVEQEDISSPINNIENATQESSNVVEEIPTGGDISQYAGTEEGQPEIRQGEGPERQSPQPGPNDSNSNISSQGPQEVAAPSIAVDYTTANGNTRVVYENGSLRAVNAKTGKEVSAPTRRRAIREAADNYVFTQGDLADESIDDVEQVIEQSANPAQLANIWIEQEPQGEVLNAIEEAIINFGGFTTTNDSFNRFGDRNIKDPLIGRVYLNNKRGESLDQIAQELSDNSGLDIQPQDLVDFMVRFPGGVAQASKTKPTAIAEKAAQKFEQITGFPLTKDIADIAYQQEVALLNEQSRQAIENLIQQEYEERQQLESDLEQLIASGAIEYIEGPIQQAPDNAGETVDSSQGVSPQSPEAVPGTASSETTAAEPVVNTVAQTAPDELSDRLAALVESINSLTEKEVTAREAKDLLQRQGKGNSVEYQVKFKAWQNVYKKLQDAQRAHNMLSAKIMARDIRKLKVRNTDAALTTPLQIPVALWNAAVETAALALEGGVMLKNAIQAAVDYVNDNWVTNWTDDEQKLREALGENLSFPLSPEEMRLRTLNDSKLSDENKRIADILVEGVRNNQVTVDEIIQDINIMPDVSPALKQAIIQYIRSRVRDDIFQASGQELADKYISENDGDFDAALAQLAADMQTAFLSADTNAERSNIRQKEAAARAFIKTRKLSEKTQAGDVKPVSIFAEAPNLDTKFSVPERTVWQKRAQELVNRYNRLEQIQKALPNELSSQNDPLIAYRLYKGRAWKVINDIRDFLGDVKYRKGSFLQRLKQSGIDLEKFGLYLYAKHATERNAANAATREAAVISKLAELEEKVTNAKSDTARQNAMNQIAAIEEGRDPDFVLMPDGGSGMTNEQAREILDEVENDGDTAKYESFAAELKENVIDKILDYKYESGLLTDEEYNKIRTAYKYYVPLKFDLEKLFGETDKSSGGMSGVKTPLQTGRTGRDIYRSTGAKEVGYDKRNNPILQAVLDLEHSVMQGEYNKANLIMAKTIEDYPNKAVWEVRPAEYDITTDKNGDVTYSREINKPVNAIPYWQDGKKKYIILNDSGLQEQFRKINPSVILNAAQNVTSWVRNFATLSNPAFIAINPLLDMQDANAYVKGQNNPAFSKSWNKNRKQFPKVVKQLLSGKGEWADLAKEWESVGGKTTFRKEVSLDDEGKKAIKAFNNYGKKLSAAQLKKVGQAIEKLTDTLESATRLIVYKSAKDAGIDEKKSAILSREATIDFEKSGSYGPVINAFKAFANAGIQGTSSIVSLAKSKWFKKAIGLSVLAGIAQAWLADMMSDCETPNSPDCYWEMDEWRKQRSFVIPLGDEIVTIPIGRRLGFFNYMGQNMYSLFKGFQTDGEQGTRPSDFLVNSMEVLADYFNPAGGSNPLLQQAAGNFAPAVGLATNEDSFGAPIVPEGKDNLPAHLQAYETTPQVFKSTADFLSSISGGGGQQKGAVEVSPEVLEYTLQSLFSGLYGFVRGSAKTASNVANEEVQVKDIPIINRFYRESSMTPSKKRRSEIIERSKTEELTEKEIDNLESIIDDLVEGGHMTPDQKKKSIKFVRMNQRKLKKRIADAENDGNNE